MQKNGKWIKKPLLDKKGILFGLACLLVVIAFEMLFNLLNFASINILSSSKKPPKLN